MQFHNFVWIMGCSFQQQEMSNAIWMIGINSNQIQAPKLQFLKKDAQRPKFDSFCKKLSKMIIIINLYT